MSVTVDRASDRQRINAAMPTSRLPSPKARKGYAAEADIDRQGAAVQEHLQICEQRTLVRKDSCVGLHSVAEVSRLPRRQNGVRCQKRALT
jgi:hypothetical protein